MADQFELDEVPEAVVDAVAEAIGGSAYDCTRCWSAWHFGTMSAQDFYEVAGDGDRVAEIARAAIVSWEGAKAKPSDDFAGWYCAHCQCVVDGSEVTFREQPSVAPVGVEGLMQLAREWCISWGEWAHDADPGCAKESAAEAVLRAALTQALAQQPTKVEGE